MIRLGDAELAFGRGAHVEISRESPGPTFNRRTTLGLFFAALSMPDVAWAAAATANRLISAARRQVGITVFYDPGYTPLAFPNGDVPRRRGVCTDVLIRAYRDAFAVDLQALVNADMRAAFATYPRTWGLKRPDRNIDHRRVPNLRTYFNRKGARLPFPVSREDWEPGDIFTSLIADRLPHIGIVSDRKARNGNPLVIHNIGKGAREEDALFDHRLTGRYRFLLQG